MKTATIALPESEMAKWIANDPIDRLEICDRARASLVASGNKAPRANLVGPNREELALILRGE